MLLTLDCLNQNREQLKGGGVYRIFSPSGKSYIGSAGTTRGLARRLKDHEQMLKSGNHHAVKLQLAWSKYGGLAFEILERVEDETLIEREQYFIDVYSSAKDGYNSNPIAGKTRMGSHLSDETKEKIRSANTGKKASEETKERMRASALRNMKENPNSGKLRSRKLIGVPHSEESKRKNSEKQRERFKDPEERKRCGRPKGYKHSEEAVEKMRGLKTKEHVRKLTESRRNRLAKPIPLEKKCCKCGEIKPVAEFYKTVLGRPGYACRLCLSVKLQ